MKILVILYRKIRDLTIKILDFNAIHSESERATYLLKQSYCISYRTLRLIDTSNLYLERSRTIKNGTYVPLQALQVLSPTAKRHQGAVFKEVANPDIVSANPGIVSANPAHAQICKSRNSD